MINKMKCRHCNDLVEKTPVPPVYYKSEAGNWCKRKPKFTDSKGGFWWGSICPDCRSSGVQPKAIRVTSGKKCLRCDNIIEGMNRFYHPSCLDLITSKYDASDYGYEYVR
jgi:hypothetical protein